MTLHFVPSDHREEILICMGHELQRLIYSWSFEIDLMELQPCTQLEELKLDQIEDILSSATDMPNEILSRLRTLDVEISSDKFKYFLLFVYALTSNSLRALRVHCREAIVDLMESNAWEELADNISPEIEDLNVLSASTEVSTRSLINSIRPILTKLRNLKSLTLSSNVRSAAKCQLG